MKLIPDKFNDKSWFKKKEVAEALGLHYESFRRRWNKGLFDGLDVSPVNDMIPRDSLEQFLKESIERNRKERAI